MGAPNLCSTRTKPPERETAYGFRESTAAEFSYYSECGKAAYMGKENKECSYQMTYEEHVICDHPKRSLVCFVTEANEEYP
jgi:hypothetical protein